MVSLADSKSPLDGQVRRKEPTKSPKFSDPVLLTTSHVAKWSLRLVFSLVVARALGPGTFGVYALLFSLVEFLAVISGAGYTDYLTREAAKDARVGWGLAVPLMLLRVAIAIPVAATEVGILALLRYPHPVLGGMAWMALTILPRSLSEAVQGVLRGIRQFAGHLVIEMVSGTGLIIGAAFVLLHHGGLRVVIVTELAASGAACLAATVFTLKFKTRESISVVGSHLVKAGLVFNVYSLITTLYDRLDVVLLSKLAGDYVTGIYSIAYRALGMTQILAYGVLYSLLPILSGNPGGEEERRRLEGAMGFLTSAALAVVLAAMVLAGPAVRFLLGDAYAESASAVKVLIWAVLLRYMNCALNMSLLAAGREKVFVMTSLVCLAVNSVGNLMLIPRYSWRGAATMTIVTELVLLAQNLYWVRRAIASIFVPRGMARKLVVFAVLLGVSLMGSYLRLPAVVGTMCLAIFAVYLYGSGTIAEFAAVWGSTGTPAA